MSGGGFSRRCRRFHSNHPDAAASACGSLGSSERTVVVELERRDGVAPSLFNITASCQLLFDLLRLGLRDGFRTVPDREGAGLTA